MSLVDLKTVFETFNKSGLLGESLTITHNDEYTEFVTEKDIEELYKCKVNFFLSFDYLSVGLHNSVYDDCVLYHFKNGDIHEYVFKNHHTEIMKVEKQLVTDEEIENYKSYLVMKNV